MKHLSSSLKFVGRYPSDQDNTITNLAKDLPAFIDSDLDQKDRETSEAYAAYVLKLNNYFRTNFVLGE